jgi:hypothetical protein
MIKWFIKIGHHFYKSDTGNYIGDIKELTEPQNWSAYKDPLLTQKQDQIRITRFRDNYWIISIYL